MNPWIQRERKTGAQALEAADIDFSGPPREGGTWQIGWELGTSRVRLQAHHRVPSRTESVARLRYTDVRFCGHQPQGGLRQAHPAVALCRKAADRRNRIG